jgi:uncharacterized protein (TIGR03437 family)
MKVNNWIWGVILIAIAFPAASWGQGYTITLVAGGGDTGFSGVPATQAPVAPGGVAVDAAGNLYIAQGSFVSKVTPNGIISVVAGSPETPGGFAGDGGPATDAEFSNENLAQAGIAVDSHGNMYIVDSDNNRIRKVDSNGIINTVAGGGSQFTAMGGDGGPATAAYLILPTSVGVDSAGNLYIADDESVRKVDAKGIITTVAGCVFSNFACATAYAITGSIGDGGAATNAYIGPIGLAIDGAGNLYIADSVDNRVRKVSTSGIITTVAGSASGNYGGDGGSATSAGLNNPWAVAVDAAGNLFIDDRGDFRVRMVTAGGTISTIAGNGGQGQGGATASGAVPATSISLGRMLGIATGPGGTVYAGDVDDGVWLLKNGESSGGAPPSISSGGVISASAFGSFTSVALGSLIEIYGQNLASDTRGWSSSDFTGDQAPTSLDGTSVTIGGQPAYVAYISPKQVNAQVPSNIGTGAQPLTVNTLAGASTTYMVTVDATAPGLLAPSSLKIGGKQYVAAFFPDGALALPAGAIAGVNSRSAKPGDTLTLYGIGFGEVTPNIPAGQIAQGSSMLTSTLQINFGATAASITYDGLAPQLVGVYQFNVVVPNIPGNDAVPLTFMLKGVAGTQTLYTSVQD